MSERTQVQPISFSSGDVSLEGIVQSPAEIVPSGILIVCHPHPLYGGSMHNNVVEALCDAAIQEGLAAFRFNFRGVGGSTGSHDGGEGEQDDVLAAVRAAGELSDGSSIGLAGYSFGASMATRALSRRDLSVTALLLVSPPLSTLGAALFGEQPACRLLVTGDRDQVCPAVDLQALAQRLHPPADCIVVEGADHSWFAHEAELRDTAGGFLRWHLAAPEQHG